MSLTIALATLNSRIQRSKQEIAGAATLAAAILTTPITPAAIRNVFTGFGAIARGFLTTFILTSVINFFTFSYVRIWQLLTSAVQFIWNFNWNASDTALTNGIKSSFNTLGGTLGTTVGSGLGYLVCGALPTATIMSFNEPLALHILEELGEEAVSEVASNVGNLVKQTGELMVKTATTYVYTNIRGLFRDSSEVFQAKLRNQGLNAEAITKSLEQRDKPWSFASKTEERIEAIPNEFLKNFTEELFEEFSDSCIESGYIIAQGIDSYIASARTAYNNTLGEEEIVEILLGRKSATPTP